jgi:hypothetical protein
VELVQVKSLELESFFDLGTERVAEFLKLPAIPRGKNDVLPEFLSVNVQEVECAILNSEMSDPAEKCVALVATIDCVAGTVIAID